MTKPVIKILFVIFTAIGILGFSGQVKAVEDPLVVEFEETPLFSEANFLPGASVTRWVKVTNNSGSSQRIAAEAINKNDPDDFSEKLNLTIKEGGTVIFNDALKKFFDQGETFLSDLANNADTRYDFTVGFNSDAGDFYQGKTLGFDIIVGFEGTEGGLPLPSPGGGTGGGGGLPLGLTIQNETVVTVTETSVTINWTTSYAATSQVIYALGSESHTLDLTDTAGAPPKYGYAHTTPESDVSPKVINHSVTIFGLSPETTYYYRTVSHGSLAVSWERSFTTLAPTGKVAGAAATGGARETGSGLAQGERIIGGESTTGEPGDKMLSPSPTPSLTGLAVGANILSALGGIFSSWWLWIVLIVIILLILIRPLIKRKMGKTEQDNGQRGDQQGME